MVVVAIRTRDATKMTAVAAGIDVIDRWRVETFARTLAAKEVQGKRLAPSMGEPHRSIRSERRALFLIGHQSERQLACGIRTHAG